MLGHRGNWSGDDVLVFALAHPATPRLIVRKLYRWLISESELPDDDYLAVLSDSFGKDYDIGRLVETMLRSNLFFSPAAYRQRIKSPVEFALGIARAMEQVVPTVPLGHDLDRLGQGLYEPPGAKGWAGGRAWINSATMLARHNLAWAILSGAGRYGETVDPAAVARKHDHATADAARRFLSIYCCRAILGPWRRRTMWTAKTMSPGGISGNGPARVSIGLKE